jgi:hypothetical protein
MSRLLWIGDFGEDLKRTATIKVAQKLPLFEIQVSTSTKHQVQKIY